MIGLSPLWLAALGERADVYGRQFLLDAGSGLLMPGFAYTRSGPDLWCPQADGSLASFEANVIPREFAGGRWGFRFDPGWTQYALQSIDLTSASWGKTRCSAVNVTFSHPLGGSAISKIIEDTSVNLPHLAQSAVTTSVAGSSYTARAVLYPDERKHAALCFTGGGGGTDRGIFVDLQTGAITGAFGSYPASYGATLRADGGVDLFITEAAPGAAGYAARVYVCSAQNISVYTGDGASGLRVAVLNLTNTAYPVPLAVAQGTAVTVGNHSCSALLADLGITLGTGYTLFAKWRSAYAAANFGTVARLDNGTNNERVVIRRASGSSYSRSVIVAAGGVAQYTANSAGSVSVLNSQALRVKLNDVRGCTDGALMTADGTSSFPAVNRVTLGHGISAGSEVLPGWLESAALIPSRALTDTELQALTAIT